MSKLREALTARDEAEKRLRHVLLAEYPVGSLAAWSGATGRIHHGTIIGHTTSKVRVRNDATHSMLAISPYSLMLGEKYRAAK